jgi:hypothetical protein
MNDSERNNEDVQARLKAFAEANGYHTNVPIFNDSYSTLVAHELARQISSPSMTEKWKRKPGERMIESKRVI